jgi:hypothetical protein
MGWARVALAGDKKAEGFFPIIPWDAVPKDAAKLQRVKDCGFTVAGLCHANELEAVEKLGMKAMVEDGRTVSFDWRNPDPAVAKKNVESLAADVGTHQGAVLGYLLVDEPHPVLFKGLGVMTAAIKEAAPGKVPFVNLLPNYANNDQLGAASYEEHLERFITDVKPTVLCYDHYALLEDGSLRGEYFKNLEQVRAAGKKHGIPFWNCVLAVGHFAYRVPNEADFRFQAYTTLVYGGKGIVYFKYTSPDVGNYRLAPIDQFGNETVTWGNLRRANLEVQTLAPWMLKLSSDAVYHFGKVPDGAKGPSEKSLVKAAKGDVVVGDFTHEDGTKYVMIVNKDVKRAGLPLPEFRKAPKRVWRVSSYSGEMFEFVGEQVWLGPGQGVLLKIEE